MIRRIAVTGPESTGKSWLTGQLALHYDTTGVAEYARTWLENLDRPYVEDDLVTIARGQLAAVKSAMKTARGFLFADTEMLVLKIWSEVRYGRCNPFILEAFRNQDFDLYLLCDIDLPWAYDPLREHPDKRKYLFDLYHDELTRGNFPFFVVSGQDIARRDAAIKCIDGFRFP